MPRPHVDVVVPFAGSDAELRQVHAHMRTLSLGPGDTLTIVDNRPAAHDPGLQGVIPAREVPSSYYARNRGVERGRAPWIIFVDADLEVSPDLVDRYFDEPPVPDTGILIGEIQTTLEAPTAVARYGWHRQHLNTSTAAQPGHEYAQTANAAIRRDAFEAVGGFCDHVRSGGDADLCFRMRARGYGFEHRRRAIVRHPSRSSLRALLRQFARYGAGRQWLHERYPDFGPPRALPRLGFRAAKGAAKALVLSVRGDRERALLSLLDPVVLAASELGRFAPNEPAAGLRERGRHLARVTRQRWSRRP